MKIKKKRLLFVSHEVGVWGSTKSLLSLIEGIKENNPEIEITVLLPKATKKSKAKAKELLKNSHIMYKEMMYRGAADKRGEKYNAKKYIFELLNYFAIIKLCIYILIKRYDCICSNSSAVDIGARAARIIHVKHIHYIREFMGQDFDMEYRNKKRMRKLLESSWGVIFISKAIEKKYTQSYRIKNFIQFYDGFIIDNYYIKQHEILDKDTIHIIQIGSFCDAKGTLNSIEIAYFLKNKGTIDFVLEFVGRGQKGYVMKMQSLIKQYQLEKNVEISLYTNDIREKLKDADILIMNSKTEGLGRVTIEGMLAGCLVMGLNNTGTAEIITHMENGILYQNKEEAANIIEDIAKEQNQYKYIAQYGQEWALDRFDHRKTAVNFCKFIGI